MQRSASRDSPVLMRTRMVYFAFDSQWGSQLADGFRGSSGVAPAGDVRQPGPATQACLHPEGLPGSGPLLGTDPCLSTVETIDKSQGAVIDVVRAVSFSIVVALLACEADTPSTMPPAMSAGSAPEPTTGNGEDTSDTSDTSDTGGPPDCLQSGLSPEGTCECAGTDVCAVTCAGADCAIGCNATSTCQLDCADAETCDNACIDSAQCDLDCSDASSCSLRCDHSTECNLRCNNECDLECAGVVPCGLTCAADSVCRETCSGSSVCNTTCESGSTCVFECTESSSCDVTCAEGATCTLECSEFASCRCRGGGCTLDCFDEPVICDNPDDVQYCADPSGAGTVSNCDLG